MKSCLMAGLALLLAGCRHASPPEKNAGDAGADEAIQAAAAPSLIDTAHLDATLRGFVAEGRAVGVSALIHERGREVYFGAFGDADREAGRAMARDTVVQIYSMTKPVTGVVLMSLFDEGKFALDDPLADYLPEYAEARVYAGLDARQQPVYVAPRRPIRVYDILRHTAGFAADTDDSPLGHLVAEAGLHDHGKTLAKLSQDVARLPLAFQPGTRWLYGPSVDVQARLAERIAGKPFAQLVQERVLDPLRMHETAYFVPPERRSRMAAMYDFADDSFTRVPDSEAFSEVYTEWPLTPGGYGLTSTLDDYMRFGRMLLEGGMLDGVRILERQTVTLMATDALPADVVERSWLPGKGQVGFGIDFAVRHSPPASEQESSGAVGEFFWDGRANTLFWVDPKNQIVAVFFTQYLPPGGIDLHKRFRDAVYVHDAQSSSVGRGRGVP
jgi:CubicO group peptidase (beta-lactamase class C family)